MSYRNLVWKEACDLSIRIHEMTLTLPKFEQLEEAQQIRRSSKSVRSILWKVMEEEYINRILYDLSFMRYHPMMKRSII